MFNRGDFHWDDRRITNIRSKKDNELKINNCIEILNKLTPEQIKAVELYGKSRYEDGIDDAESYYP